ncbi:MAG: alginate export family protein [Verrucomicrobiota bacterium]
MNSIARNLTATLAFLLAASPLAAQSTNTPAAAASGPAPATTVVVFPAAAATPAPGPMEQTLTEIKHPVSWLTWDGDTRERIERFDNALTLGNNEPRSLQNYLRFRERFWMSVTPLTNFSFNARLSGEQREWLDPSYSSQFGVGRTGFEPRYGIVDSMNVKLTDAFNQPLTLTAGRQDIMIGEPLNWWLVADGTPADGSWTTFLNAVRATYKSKEAATSFDVALVNQAALPDQWIPTIGNSSENVNLNGQARPYYLTEQNENGVVLYVSNKSVENLELGGFFLYKNDSQEGLIRSPYGTPLGDIANINAIGGKVAGTPSDHVKYSVEGAYEFGGKADPMVRYPVVETGYRTLSAYGVVGNVTYQFKDAFNNQVSLVFENLSGDKANTPNTDEMFDVLWGRWPRFSEMYIYSYVNETGGKIAQLNNTGRVGANWSCNPVKPVTFSLAYNALFAPTSIPTRVFVAPVSQVGQFSMDGHFRGNYFQSVLRFNFNKHVSAHLWGEMLWMGNYYTQHDLMNFFRAELLLTF